jgi:hypothetical protein
MAGAATSAKERVPNRASAIAVESMTGAERTVPRDGRLAGEHRRRRLARRRALAVDDDDTAVARGIDDDGGLAAETEVRNLHDGAGKDRRDAGIDRVAAGGKHARAGFDGERPSRGHDAARRADFRTERREGLLRRRRRRGRERADGSREGRHYLEADHS